MTTMNPTDKITALRDALTRIAAYPKTRRDELTGMNCRRIAREAIDLSDRLVALTADASDQTPAKRTTADYSLDSALAQMRGLYALMIEFKVPHARAANSAAHVESAIRHLHRIANATDTARPAPVAATPAPDVEKMLETNQLDELGQEVARLQKALCFWLPSITDREDEVAERILQDAFLLCGIDGNIPDDFKSAQELGWVALAAAPAAPIAEVTGEPVLIGFDLASGPDTGVTDEFPQVERLQINLMELVEDSERNQPCAHGSLVDGHAVYCHNGTWKDAPRKCRRTWYTGGETRDQDCEGFAPNANSPAAEHAKPEPVVMGLAQDEAASGKQAAKHHGDAQSNQALISVTGHFGHRQVATPAPRSDAHAKRADVASERDSFEVYWRKVDLSPSLQYQNRFEINCEGNYLYVETRLAWETWQARGQQAGAVDGEASCQ